MAHYSIPIVLVGKDEWGVRHLPGDLMPDYKVIHFIRRSAVSTEIPQILRGEVLSGQKQGGRPDPPRAILFSSDFGEEDITSLRELAAGIEGARRIPWVYIDPNPAQETAGLPGHSLVMAERFKKRLDELKAKRLLNWDGDNGVYTA
ncbi:hypothetical protein OQA88_2628 [Cercophora sp. LCS_1]